MFGFKKRHRDSKQEEFQKFLTRIKHAFDKNPDYDYAKRSMPGGYFDSTQEMIDWLSSNRDPDLWHEIVSGFNYDLPSTKAVIKWIIAQDDCELATALLILDTLELDYYLGIDTIPTPDRWDYDGFEILQNVTNRLNRSGYTRKFIADISKDRAGFFERIAQIRIQLKSEKRRPLIDISNKILDQSWRGRSTLTPWSVDECGFSGLQLRVGHDIWLDVLDYRLHQALLEIPYEDGSFLEL